MAGVFLSYRRDDAAGYALGVNDALRARGFKVFMDLDSIGPGKPFPEVIKQALDSSEALIALIGRRWLTAEDDEGRKRLDSPRDYVRREIAAGLERDILVIPTLVDGATMPAEEDLPDELAELATRHALELDNQHWNYDLGRLIASLEGRRGPGFTARLKDMLRSLRLPRRTWIVLAATLAVAAAVAAFMLTRGDGGGNTDGEDVVVERVASAALSAPDPGQQLIWSAVSDGETLAAVGRVARGQGRDAPKSAAAWRSTDGGASWTVSPVAGSGSAARQEMKSVARLPGSGLIAVGHQDGEPTVWISSDGSSWGEPQPQKRPGDQFVSAVVATPTLVVAAGSQDVGGGRGRDAAVWWSSDGGVTWADGSGAFGGDVNQEIKGVVGLPNGLLVAVGYDDDVGEAVVWRSRDAQKWRRIRISAREDTEQMAAVAAGAGALIAVGREGVEERADAAVWKSTNNGRTWRRIAAADFDLAGEQVMTGVVVSDAGVFAVGSEKTLDGPRRAAIWRSTDDGESWLRVSSSTLDGDDGAGSMTTAVAVDGFPVGLGEGNADAAVWRTRAP
jgi:TIR domain/BNR repeat-like domain